MPSWPGALPPSRPLTCLMSSSFEEGAIRPSHVPSGTLAAFHMYVDHHQSGTPVDLSSSEVALQAGTAGPCLGLLNGRATSSLTIGM